MRNRDEASRKVVDDSRSHTVKASCSCRGKPWWLFVRLITCFNVIPSCTHEHLRIRKPSYREAVIGAGIGRTGAHDLPRTICRISLFSLVMIRLVPRNCGHLDRRSSNFDFIYAQSQSTWQSTCRQEDLRVMQMKLCCCPIRSVHQGGRDMRGDFCR